MKKRLLRPLSFIFLAGFTALAYGQPNCNLPQHQEPLNGNNVRAMILTGGDLFWDGAAARFQVPYQPGGPSTIFAQGLWLGGIDPGGNLKVAAQTYGRGRSQGDFWPGPLEEEGLTNTANCENWDRAFTVLRYQIEAHITDFEDNGVVDNPIPEILGWPGQGNPHFSDVYGIDLPDTPQGLAPFADEDGDGRYDPLAGDYPIIRNSAVIPSQITWVVFNDNGNIHSESNGDPLQMEVQLTSWAFDCTDNPQLNHTVFTSYKLINRGNELLDSLYLGLWTDFDLGCYTDDYFGSAPGLNTTFAYNQDNDDDLDCPSGVKGYGENPPVQAVTVLNHTLSFLMYYLNPGVIDPPPAVIDPSTPLEYYRYLTGRWRDGTPLTFGGNGYDPSLSNPVTNLAFPGDPNNPDEWSALHTNITTFADRRTISSVSLGTLPPGGVEEVDFGYTFFRAEGAGHLGNVTAMYAGIETLQGWYDSQFESACSQEAICEEDCIWAGDANADGIANHCDLLAIAVGAEAQGPTRGAPYNWSPQDGAPWAGQQPNGANNKHLDADGSGAVAFEDFMLSEQHYNFTRPGYQPPAPEYREGPELVLDNPLPSFDFDNLAAGQSTVLGRVQLATVPELYALAFSLEYDTAYFEVIEGEFVGYNLDGRTFISRPGVGGVSGQLDYARAATDGVIESGRLMLLLIETKEELLYPLPADTTLIRFKNIKAIRSDGTEIEIGGTTVVARFPGVMVDAEEASADRDIQLFPNPTDGRLELRFPGQQVDGIEVFTATGRRVWRRAGPFIDDVSFDLQHLPVGVYFVRMQLGEAVLVRKVVVQ